MNVLLIGFPAKDNLFPFLESDLEGAQIREIGVYLFIGEPN